MINWKEILSLLLILGVLISVTASTYFSLWKGDYDAATYWSTTAILLYLYFKNYSDKK